MRVLTVEDEGLVLLELAPLIRQAGHGPVMATNGVEALRPVNIHRPGLVLMDICLVGPLSDGIEVAKEIRRRHICRLLFVTAIGDTQTRERAAAAHPDAYLTKPFRPAELRACMEQLRYAN
ncbi:MAG: response regulator [Dehalococcoidia bacterium]